ncbi:cytochrome c family protein [Myxococcota bacterium]|nr:cytochrome c family protein [Myxococcota bacterium]
MERILNGVLWALLLGMGGLLVWDRAKDRLLPAPFEQPKTHAAALVKIAETAPEERAPWIVEHFKQLPLPPQGPAPEGWSPLEASLDPESCGACHPQQLADWKTSWHAGAMGPGVTGQLIDWADKPGLKRQCLSCHAPLDEQQAVLEDGAANPNHQEGLAASAVGCASCHIRQHTRFGPPKDVAPNPEGPHGGYEAKAEFKRAQMCESCHDFKDGQKSLEGKLLQETWDEWRRTRFAAEGVTCQSCHMPEGRHTFKGIHDPEMARAAFTATTKLVNPGEGLLEPLLVELTITNVGAGHRFPTYTTPQVTLIIEQVNAAGEVIEGTRQEGAVARYVKPDLTTEIYDTRLLPDQSFTLSYAARRDGEAVALNARVEIWPDEAYRRFYEIKLRKPENHPLGEAELRQALQNSLDSRFVAWEQRLPLEGT